MPFLIIKILKASRLVTFSGESFCFLQSATVCGPSRVIGSEALQWTCQGVEDSDGDSARGNWLGTNDVGAKVKRARVIISSGLWLQDNFGRRGWS